MEFNRDETIRRIREAREHKNYTQEQASILLGKAKNYISVLESDKKKCPGPWVLRSLSYIYNVSMDHFLGLDQEKWFEVYLDVFCQQSSSKQMAKKNTLRYFTLTADNSIHIYYQQIRGEYNKILSMPVVSENSELSKKLLAVVMSERLKFARIARGYTVKEVAEIMKTPKSTIYLAELGRWVPKSDTLCKYCKLYHVPADWICGWLD